MNKYDYRVSVIVPIYNMEKFLRNCLNSLVEQTIPAEDMEILLIDDGSPDNSIEIMKEFASKYPNMVIYRKENEGLSMTRNYGIERAHGKYIMYLDADDTLTPPTVKSVVDFFDKHYDEVDLVTYTETPIIEGAKQPEKRHFRFKTMVYSGIYDLENLENAFITQTRINICVKNIPGENILFDNDRTFRQEDQKYCTEILRRKMKIGFCDKGEYLYLHQPESIVRTFFFAYYIFESTMRYWEKLFSEYPARVPYYIQAMYLNDVSWKTSADILLPYHYSPEMLEEAKTRIRHLLDRVEDCVILKHPKIGQFHKSYFISLKTNNEIRVVAGPCDTVVLNHDRIIYSVQDIEIYIRKFKINNNRISILALIKSPLFTYLDKPTLYLVQNKDFAHMEEIPLRLSSWSYYNAKVRTNNFWLFNVEIITDKPKTFEFLIEAGGKRYAAEYTFSKDLGIIIHGKKIAKFECCRDGKIVRLTKGVFSVNKATGREKTKDLIEKKKRLRGQYKVWAVRNYIIQRQKLKEKIWLYYDCKGVGRDNGYFQFDHDFPKKDGVKRYYVVNEENYDEYRRTFPSKQRAAVVKFGSWRHRILYLLAQKVITAFIERNNYWPFDYEVFNKYRDLCADPDIIYLQHGVLHSHQPWKYSLDRLAIDKEVISTTFEEYNLTHNYCFTEKELLPSGMPRYDLFDFNQESVNRILFAPSWRKYLVGMNGTEWVTTDSKFLQSQFFDATTRFLNSKKLQELLEQYDFYLDFKLHPILERYKHLYKITNPRVTMAEHKIKETTYKVFMTDFSSFVYDFVYLKKPIIYYLPDEELFRAGLNDYREVDMPLEDAFGEFVKTPEDAVDAIQRVLENGCVPEERYAMKMDNMFFFKDHKQRDRIYAALISEK